MRLLHKPAKVISNLFLGVGQNPLILSRVEGSSGFWEASL